MLPTFDRSLNPDDCLGATWFIDLTAPAIQRVATSLDFEALPDAERAMKVFRFVRDQIRYQFMAKATPGEYVATRTLADGQGFCVQKAVLACALGRAVGVPTAIVLADLRDRSLPERVVEAIGTDVMFHHGLNAFYVGGAWRIADASLSEDLVIRKRYRQVDFDGTEDAVLAPTTLDGRPHAEYRTIHGIYADLPFEQMARAFELAYANADRHKLSALGLTW